jgi:hypothetical protein
MKAKVITLTLVIILFILGVITFYVQFEKMETYILFMEKVTLLLLPILGGIAASGGVDHWKKK